VKKAVVYLRVSTAKQANTDIDPDGYSLLAQREACYRKAQELGAEIVSEYVDRGETAKTSDRPEFQRMVERIVNERDIDFVILDKIDRFARNRRDDANIVFELRMAGARLVSVKENIDDTPPGQLVHAIMAGIAEFYSKNLATEALKGMSQKAKMGGTPGRAPIGYLNVRQVVDGREIRTIAIDPERAPLVRWAFEQYATGEWTVDELTKELARKGLRAVPTARRLALPLQVSRVAHMLNNIYYTGVVRFKGAEYPGRHEPLITEDLFLKVQEILSGRRHAKERRRNHDNYLKGTVFCELCKSRLCLTLANGNGGAYLYYFCSGRQRGNGCPQPYMLADDVEEAVVEFYRAVQLEPERVEKLRVRLTAELARQRKGREREARRQEARLERLAAERGKLMQALYADAVPIDLFRTEQARITREQVQGEELLAGAKIKFHEVESSIQQGMALAASLYETYRGCTDQERRQLNQGLFEALWVRDGRVTGATMTEPFARLLAEDLTEHLNRESEAPEVVLSGVGSNKRDLVGPTGFEPVTHGLRVHRSDQTELRARREYSDGLWKSRSVG
jgi:site-specific DNA recombinase